MGADPHATQDRAALGRLIHDAWSAPGDTPWEEQSATTQEAYNRAAEAVRDSCTAEIRSIIQATDRGELLEGLALNRIARIVGE